MDSGPANDMPTSEDRKCCPHPESLRIRQGVLVLRDGEQPEPAVLGGQLLQAARHVLVHCRPQHARLTSAEASMYDSATRQDCGLTCGTGIAASYELVAERHILAPFANACKRAGLRAKFTLPAVLDEGLKIGYM